MILRYSDIWIFGYLVILDIWIFGYLDIWLYWIFGYLVILDIWIFGYLDTALKRNHLVAGGNMRELLWSMLS